MISAIRRAYRHLRWVLVFAAARWVAGWLLALLPLSVVKASLISALPGGDARLFEPGGLLLVEFFRLHGAEVWQALRSSVPLFFLVLTLLLVPMAKLLSALAGGDADAQHRALHPRTLWRLLALMIASAVSGMLVMAVTLIPTLIVLNAVEPRTPLVRYGAWAVAGAATLALIGGVAVLQDLARVAIVRDGLRVTRSLRCGLESLRLRLVPAFSGALSVVCLSLLWIAGVSVIVGGIDVARQDAWRVWASFALHLAAIGGLTWLRAVWLARAAALTLSNPAVLRPLPKAPGETPERSAALADPTRDPDASHDAPQSLA